MKPWFALVFLLVLIFQTSSGLINTALLALRKAEYAFAQNLVLGVRIFFLIPLTFAAVLGIFGSLGISYLVYFIIGIFLLYKRGITLKLVFKRKAIKDIIPYSLENYIADFLLIAESSILPILILNIIGAREAAYFYIAFSIANLLYAVPNSVFTSLFIEGSHDEPIRKSVIKSLVVVGAVLIPVGFLMYFFGNVFLSFFGSEYSQNAYEVLKLLVLSSVFVTFNALYMAIKRIQKDMKPLIAVNALLFVSTVFFSYFFMQRYGILGVGLGWMASQGMTAIVVGMMIRGDQTINITDHA